MIDAVRLKYDLMTKGINVPAETKDFLISAYGEKFYKDDYVTTTGLMLEFDNGICVTTGMRDESPYGLVAKDGNLFIAKSDDKDFQGLLPAKLWEPNPYLTENGTDRFGPSISAQFDRVRISLICGCSFHCAFCSLNEIPYNKSSVENLTVALEEALKDERVTHVLITGGSPKEEDLPYLTEVYEYFCKKFPGTEFDIMMAPRGFTSYTDDSQYLDYLKHLRDIGVHGLSINLELCDEKTAQKYCKEKAAIGKERYAKFLKLASEVFGPKNVRSAVIVGLEDKESTIEGIKMICACGCQPVLSPYIPYNGIGEYPDTEYLMDIGREATQIVKSCGLEIAPVCDSKHKGDKNNTLESHDGQQLSLVSEEQLLPLAVKKQIQKR